MRVRVEIGTVRVQGHPQVPTGVRELARALEARIAAAVNTRDGGVLDHGAVTRLVTGAVRDGLAGEGES